jgi:hypothetical protein
MKKILIFWLLVLSNACSYNRENIIIVNQSLNQELENFVDDLQTDSFQLQKDVTVEITRKDNHDLIALINCSPSSCQNLQGICYLKDDFVVYFVSHDVIPSLFKKRNTYSCSIQEHKTDTSEVPVAFHFNERFFRLTNDSLESIKIISE